MEILQVIVFGLAATLLIELIGKDHQTFQMILRMLASTILMIFIIGKLTNVFGILGDLAIKIHLDNMYLTIILKIIVIAYVAEFGYQLCKDAGEGAIASKIQLAGKVMIFAISSPILFALVELITKLL
ncbi:MAG: stage III sporulation protein AD [Cellulosilyticaceae bacterium]